MGAILKIVIQVLVIRLLHHFLNYELTGMCASIVLAFKGFYLL